MKILILLFLTLFSYAADTLINALTQGTIKNKTVKEVTHEDDEPKNQDIGFHYTSAPLYGFRIEVENNSLDAYAKALYSGEFSDFGYTLSANNNITNMQTYAVDINYNLRRELTLGSRYTLSNNTYGIVSYTGIYSSFLLDNLSKGLNLDVSFDKIGEDKKEGMLNLKIKSSF